MNWTRNHISDTQSGSDDFKNTLREFDLGNLTQRQIAHYLAGLAGETSVASVDAAFNGIQITTIDEELVEYIKQLREKGYKTALLSNGHYSFFEEVIFRKYPYFESLFNVVVVSSEAKMVKPDKDIYLYTLDKCNVRPQEAIFIDDSPANVATALELGMKGVVYTTVADCKIQLAALGVEF